jgi:Holliday junction resolvasome RuvABC endonuclease subunit
MRILGIDPGTATVGWGVIQWAEITKAACGRVGRLAAIARR